MYCFFKNMLIVLTMCLWKAVTQSSSLKLRMCSLGYTIDMLIRYIWEKGKEKRKSPPSKRRQENPLYRKHGGTFWNKQITRYSRKDTTERSGVLLCVLPVPNKGEQKVSAYLRKHIGSFLCPIKESFLKRKSQLQTGFNRLMFLKQYSVLSNLFIYFFGLLRVQ